MFLIKKATSAGFDKPVADADEQAGFFDVCNRTVVVCGGVIVFCEQAFGSIQPTLAPFLMENFFVTEPQAAYLFAVTAGTYAIIAPFIGWITEKFNSRTIMITGCCVMGSAFVFIGPFVPLTENFYMKWFILIVSLACAGIGLSLMFVPTLPTVFKIYILYI